MGTNKKERKEFIVTIINENILGSGIFRLMYKSIEKNTPKLFEHEWFVLFPKKMDINAWLDTRQYTNVKFKNYPVYESSDQYTLKFMLINFIEEIECSNGNVTYFDADHIFLSKMTLPKISEREVVFSSEDSIINSYKYGRIRNYNSSFIRSDIETWREIMYDWRINYEKLGDDVSVRFREEIAFSLAAIQHNLVILQLMNAIQSNYQKFTQNCCCFHYGGEYPESKNVKRYIKDLNRNNGVVVYTTLLDREKWIENIIYKLMNDI